MSKKQVVYTLTFFFLASAAMLTPVVLPYFTLETSAVDVPTVKSLDSIQEYAKALGAQSQRNIGRLKTSLFFAKWFVLSFAIFVTSSLSLLGLSALKIIEKLRGTLETKDFHSHK